MLRFMNFHEKYVNTTLTISFKHIKRQSQIVSVTDDFENKFEKVFIKTHVLLFDNVFVYNYTIC